jgi:hypothetical protein
MKFFASAIVCIVMLYLGDMFFIDGKYFDAVTAVISHVLYGY